MAIDYAADGKSILNNIVLGTGVGASATGLYYLAKKLRKQFEEQLEKNKPVAPDYNEVALDVPSLPAPEQKKLAFDTYTVATPLATGAAGAILAAALSDKKNKKRNALIGGGIGAAAGAGLNTKPVHEFVGRRIPTSLYWPFTNSDPSADTFAREGWKRFSGPAGAALGVLGGKTLYDIAATPYIEAEKKKEQYDSVNSARQQYFAQLLGDEDESKSKKEKKSSIHETLDAAYTAYAEKGASWYDWVNPVNLLRAHSIAVPAAILGGGVVGSKYMYDKTIAASRAKNMAKALAAKERMKNVAPVWVDPQELALVADAAKAKETPDDKGA